MQDKPIVYPLETTGLWGESVRQRKPIITNDYAAPDPHKRGTPEGHVPIVRHMNIPVFQGDRIVAVAGVGNKSTDYDEGDLRQLQLLMDGWWQIVMRKKTQEELHQHAVAIELANQTLKELNQVAESATRAKSEFLANMSHEIRTPMTAILGFSDLLLSPNLPYNEQREFLAGIQRNGKALLELIDDILDLSRIEADRLTLEKMDCPLRQIVDDVLSTVQVQAQEKRLNLKVDYRFPLPETIRTDPARLRQILVNLLGNAVKFTGQGDVRLTIRCLREAAGPPRIQFAVSDAGIGIPADKIGELFQPFVQVDGSATRRYGGTGLGLAISKRLAEALGGDIEVISELGKGSTFTLTIDPGSLDGVRMLQGPKTVAAADVEPVRQRTEPVTARSTVVGGR